MLDRVIGKGNAYRGFTRVIADQENRIKPLTTKDTKEHRGRSGDLVIEKNNSLPRIYADDRGSGKSNKTFNHEGHEGTQRKYWKSGEAVVGHGRKKKPLWPRGQEGCVWLEKLKDTAYCCGGFWAG